MKLNFKIKNQNRLLLIIAIITMLGAGGCLVWYLIPRPPHAEIVTISDVKEFKSAEDWYGKVTRWEVVSTTTQGYDPKKDEYGFLGRVRIKGASDTVIAGLSTKGKNKKYDIEKGDVVYAKTYEVAKLPVLGNLIKGDILYVEKGGANK